MSVPISSARLVRMALVMLAGYILADCTTMLATTSIEPYTKNKISRDSVEHIAEQYCIKKRSGIDDAHEISLPDYIFTTDGCSRWPDGTWVSCCVLHDILYWCGGSNSDRKRADQFLSRCVKQKAGVMGPLMYIGVRVGGSPWLPTPWRWGYGWEDWPRGYEKKETKASLDDLFKELNAYQVIESHF